MEDFHKRFINVFEGGFRFNSGTVFPNIQVAYETYGTPSSTRSNVIVICHALTGDSHVASHDKMDRKGWWEGLVGPGKVIDTDKYFVICQNILGSCYGTTGPSNLPPALKDLKYSDFPIIDIRDMVRVQYEVLRRLGISDVLLVIGGSLGGMQALEWARMYGRRVKNVIAIATGAASSSWVIGSNETQQQMIMVDPAWKNGDYKGRGPIQGLKGARMIAMLTYRSPESLEMRFGRRIQKGKKVAFPSKLPFFEIESYLQYQGEKLVNRFDARSYVTLLQAMNHHDIYKGFTTPQEALTNYSARTLIVGISSDQLFPVEEVSEVAKTISKVGVDAQYRELVSIHGHDAFLIEIEKIGRIIKDFLLASESKDELKRKVVTTSILSGKKAWQKPIVVLKYGGSSLSVPERIKSVASFLKQKREEGLALVVVVSAMGKTTEKLLALSKAVSQSGSEREKGLLLSTGEVISASLLTMALQELKTKAVALTGWQVGIRTDALYSDARIIDIDTEKILSYLRQGYVVVVTGFQGQYGEEVTVLGRGGSDISAVALAVALSAEECIIYSDVDGLFSGTPKYVRNCKLVPVVSFEEMIELAASGVKLLHVRAAEIARRFNKVVYLGNSFNGTINTTICREEENMERPVVIGTTLRSNISLIRQVGVAGDAVDRILAAVAKKNINIILLITKREKRKEELIFLIDKSDFIPTQTVLTHELPSKIIESLQIVEDAAMVSIVGSGIARTPGIASRFFRILHRHKIKILMTSCSEIKISAVIPLKEGRRAENLLHEEFCSTRA